MPGRPWRTGLYEMENSPRYMPTISGCNTQHIQRREGSVRGVYDGRAERTAAVSELFEGFADVFNIFNEAAGFLGYGSMRNGWGLRCSGCINTHLDLNLVEGLAVVHTNHGANHLRDDDHVAQVGAHGLGLLARGSLLLLQRVNIPTTIHCESQHRSQGRETRTFWWLSSALLDQG
jgi:hypothetical protein